MSDKPREFWIEFPKKYAWEQKPPRALYVCLHVIEAAPVLERIKELESENLRWKCRFDELTAMLSRYE
jgi:hypothetical protein